VSGIEETSVRALAKLEQVLPARLRGRVTAVGDATVPVLLDGGPRAEPSTVGTLAAACRDHELLRFGYRGRDGTASTRRVEPHHLVIYYKRWYLIGYDTERADWRTFRVDRMDPPEPLHRRFSPRELPAPDVAGYLTGAIASAPYRYTGEVIVRTSAETVLARLVLPMPGRVTPVGEHSASVRLGADTPEEAAQQLLAVAALGAPFTVTGNQELLDHLRAVGRHLNEALTPREPPH
jgi:predicted DNA-binding transcriptional regulator YafY